MGLIQIDSVNVLVRSQELTLFARLGAAPSHADRRRHAAPASCSSTGCTRPAWCRPTQYHLFRWRMAGPIRWPGFRRRVETAGRLHRGGVPSGWSTRARWWRATSRRGSGKKGTWWDHDDGKTRPRGAVLPGRVIGAPATRRLRPHLRPHRADDPARGPGSSGAARARRPQGAARAGRAVPRHRHARATWPTTTGSRPPSAARPWPSWWRRAAWSRPPCASGTARPTCIPRRVGPAGSRPGRC